jgi:hypothetical protein
VLLHKAAALRAVDDGMARALSPEVLDRIVDQIPDAWLGEGDAGGPGPMRAAYRRYLTDRLAAPRAFVDEALRVR